MLIIESLTLTLKKDLRVLIKDLNLTLNQNDKIAIIGEEGNGKSSLLKTIYNQDEASKYLEIDGKIFIKNENICYLEQIIEKDKLNISLNELINKEIDFSMLDYKKYYFYLDEFKLDEAKFFDANIKLKDLSGGERIKLLLLLNLLKEPSILLLDEPSNDLDISSLEVLENLVNKLDIPVIFVSHDETFLSRCANKIIHIESLKSKSEPRVTISNLNYLRYKELREDFINRNEALYKKDKENYEQKIEKYNRVYNSVNYALNTVSRSEPGVAKNLKDKMHSVKAMGKRYKKEKENLTKKYEIEEAINIKFDQAKTFSSSNSKIKYLIDPNKIVLDFKVDKLKVPNSDIVLVDSKISLFIKGPRKVAIIGDNGAGKSTLLKAIYEKLKGDSSLKLGYMSQYYEDELESFKTPIDYLSNALNVSKKEELTKIQTYLGSLKFTYEEMNKEIKNLSGGERAKIFFAKLVLSDVNVILLDEPTRNISPLSLDSFILSMKDFKGCLIFISHDRKFINEVSDEIYLLNKNGLNKLEKEDF